MVLGLFLVRNVLKVLKRSPLTLLANAFCTLLLLLFLMIELVTGYNRFHVSGLDIQ